MINKLLIFQNILYNLNFEIKINTTKFKINHQGKIITK
jgi:hypothetical protein